MDRFSRGYAKVSKSEKVKIPFTFVNGIFGAVEQI